jgi:hypothetical protein
MEEWKWVVGYENEYAVSNTGKIYSHKTKKYLSLINRPDGYISVSFWRNDRSNMYLVHNLVLEAFIGPRPEGQEARHYPDTTRSNNNVNNLQWSTHIVNEQDKANILNDDQVIAIKNRLLQVKNYSQVAKEFNVINMTVSQIARGVTYSNIGPDLSSYNFDSRHILTDDERLDIRAMLNNNEKVTDIMKRHSICRAQVYRIKNNEMNY